MKNLLLIFNLISLGFMAEAQSLPVPTPAHTEAIRKIAFIEGEWVGSGWIQMGPERHEFKQTEQVVLKVNGTILQIDGLGIDAKDNKTVIHNAFGIITYNPESEKYLMQAFRGDGARIDAYLKPLNNESFEWGFKHPMAGDMRYIITVKDDVWVETGEMSKDGKTWYKFIEMKLSKK